MTKICRNPDCRKKFTPGHYGKRQLVCSRRGCVVWYKGHWVQTRRPPRGIPERALEEIKKAAEADPRMHSLIVAARDSGLRKGELLGLTWDDVLDRQREVKRTVEVRGQWEDGVGFKRTKTKRSRLGYFSSQTRQALRKYIGRFPGSLGSNGGWRDRRVWPVSESQVWKYFVQIQRALKIRNPETGEPYRFHDLRHSVGRELVKAGRIDLAKKMLGHRKLETTMIYAEESPEEILEDVEKIRRRG